MFVTSLIFLGFQLIILLLSSIPYKSHAEAKGMGMVSIKMLVESEKVQDEAVHLVQPFAEERGENAVAREAHRRNRGA